MIIMQNQKNSQLIEQIACNRVNTFGLVVSMEDTGGGGDIEWDGGPSDCDLSIWLLRSGLIRFGVFEADLAESLVKCK